MINCCKTFFYQQKCHFDKLAVSPGHVNTIKRHPNSKWTHSDIWGASWTLDKGPVRNKGSVTFSNHRYNSHTWSFIPHRWSNSIRFIHFITCPFIRVTFASSVKDCPNFCVETDSISASRDFACNLRTKTLLIWGMFSKNLGNVPLFKGNWQLVLGVKSWLDNSNLLYPHRPPGIRSKQTRSLFVADQVTGKRLEIVRAEFHFDQSISSNRMISRKLFDFHD